MPRLGLSWAKPSPILCRWDLDKTYLHSEFDTLRQLWRTAFERGEDKIAMPGVPVEMRKMWEEQAVPRLQAGLPGGGVILSRTLKAIGIGESARTPVHIFHLKTAGQANWGKMDLALGRIHAARAAGREVDTDVYPYVNTGLGLEAFVHPRYFAGGQEKFFRDLKDPAVRAEIRRAMEE